MNVIIILEHRFSRTPDGRVWTQTTFPYSFWLRYLKVFDRVTVVARVLDVPSVAEDWQLADGEMVSFAAVPNYLGPSQYLRKIFQVKQAVQNALGESDAVIIRAPSPLSGSMLPLLLRNNRPFAVEVVADPYDVFAPGSIDHPLRAFFRWSFTRKLQHVCAKAIAAMYVTKFALQQRYPCPNLSAGISDVVLPEQSIVAAPRPLAQKLDVAKLVFIGTMSQLYKAPDVLIKAVAVCAKEGLNIQLQMLGDGQYRGQLEELAKAENVSDRVSFLGQLASGSAVQQQLDEADLFVLPSHQEGLPRAMVEAMARALPCVGTTVGGVPELLPPEDLVAPGDVEALARKIQEIVTNPDRMAQMSARNLETAREYRDEVLQDRRTDFYRQVRSQTEVWLSAQNEPLLNSVSIRSEFGH
ncbi:glycosyltransferase family 4 protein [Chamaesiphon polymorphus]|uniref:Glycosyl transferase family 1 n=1 Tax=Chamaesiphon polymorphus CCALA 037 TaxID=2107692 RepID=A0A2T1GL79_9CYAN|nr:glycosyltransferase family 4 protein [Chamaesiphon polymorphus]PSB58614.1 glycosyl transferase family 1 [Chamaesiphon polymorphus CCALA 037]